MLKIENNEIITSDGTTYTTTSYITSCYENGDIEKLQKEKETIAKQTFQTQETRRIMYGVKALIYELTNGFDK